MADLVFKYGAMGSSKTAALLMVAHNYNEKGMEVKIIKPKVDKKGNDYIVSRIGLNRKVDIVIDNFEKIPDYDFFSNTRCILVDEAQFLTKNQVKELYILSKIYDIPVVCYGLKTNFKGELFEGSKALFELADKIDELTTICECGKKARFNARIENNEYVVEGKEIAIDNIDAKYESLCGKCFLTKVLKIEYKSKKEKEKNE